MDPQPGLKLTSNDERLLADFSPHTREFLRALLTGTQGAAIMQAEDTAKAAARQELATARQQLLTKATAIRNDPKTGKAWQAAAARLDKAEKELIAAREAHRDAAHANALDAALAESTAFEIERRLRATADPRLAGLRLMLRGVQDQLGINLNAYTVTESSWFGLVKRERSNHADLVKVSSVLESARQAVNDAELLPLTFAQMTQWMTELCAGLVEPLKPFRLSPPHVVQATGIVKKPAEFGTRWDLPQDATEGSAS